jgi:hypothetical protein
VVGVTEPLSSCAMEAPHYLDEQLSGETGGAMAISEAA